MDIGQVASTGLSNFLKSIGNSQGDGFQAAMTAGDESEVAASAGTEDSAELSEGTTMAMRYAKVKYELNYKLMASISDSQGSQSFSFEANMSFEYTATSFYAGVSSADGSSTSLQDTLAEIFDPEGTAQNILDFALSFAPQGASEEEMQSFIDTISGAIEKGFSMAEEILGDVGDDIQSLIDETHDLVFSGLQDYIDALMNPEETESEESESDDSASDSAPVASSFVQYSSLQLNVSYRYSYTQATADVTGIDSGAEQA